MQTIESQSQTTLELIAYRLPGPRVPILPAPAEREWMSGNQASFANRCLPLRIANQAGWVLLAPYAVEASWNGGVLRQDVNVRNFGPANGSVASSQFGYGIITWGIPYIFRTPPGYNLHVRGPANWWKENAIALEGIVESDWADVPFTMNWKLTRIDSVVRFEQGEPFCMISFTKRGELEAAKPRIVSVDDEPELKRKWEAWLHQRRLLNAVLRGGNTERRWQGHYYLGTHPSNPEHFEEHQTRLRLQPFQDEADAL